MSSNLLDPAVIAALGPLVGTLEGQQTRSSLQAQQDLQQQALADQAAQAAQQQQQAQQQYQQLAAAPAPQLGNAAFVPTLLNAVASVVSGNEGYRQTATQQLSQQQSSLMEQRRSNLEALRQVYDQKAQAAAHAGDLATEEKVRLQKERLDRTITEMDERRKNELAAIEAELGRRNAIRIAQIRANNDAADARAQAAQDQQDVFKSLERTTRNGNKWMDIGNITDAKTRNAALAYAAKHGLHAADKSTGDRLNTGEEVFQNFDQIEDVLRRHLYPGKDFAGRVLHGAMNLGQAWTQQESELGSFGNTQLAAIRNIQALASGVGSGFRLNEQEIKRAIANFPKITDNLPTAMRKIQWERDFLKAKERATFGQVGKANAPAASSSWLDEALQSVQTPQPAGAR